MSTSDTTVIDMTTRRPHEPGEQSPADLTVTLVGGIVMTLPGAPGGVAERVRDALVGGQYRSVCLTSDAERGSITVICAHVVAVTIRPAGTSSGGVLAGLFGR